MQHNGSVRAIAGLQTLTRNPIKPAMPIYLRLIFVLVLSSLHGCGYAPQPAKVKVSQVPAQGLTDASFDQGYLQQLIEETRQAAQARLDEAYERNHIAPAERTSRAVTDGRYAQRGGRPLAVIELSYSGNPMRVTRIVGIVDDRLVTVSCISPRGAPVEPFAGTGECAEGVSRHFPAEP